MAAVLSGLNRNSREALAENCSVAALELGGFRGCKSLHRRQNVVSCSSDLLLITVRAMDGAVVPKQHL